MDAPALVRKALTASPGPRSLKDMILALEKVERFLLDGALWEREVYGNDDDSSSATEYEDAARAVEAVAAALIELRLSMDLD